MSKSVRDDTHSDYHSVKAKAAQSMRRGVWTDRFQPRFVPFSSREMRCDLSREAIDRLSEGKHYISYRGVTMAKDPLDLVLYETLLFEVQPRTVIELGAYTGASAWWLADTLRTLELDSHVFAVDIDLSLVDEAPRQRDDIQFVQGDCNRIEELFPAERLAELPHPWVVIDDAHVNIDGVYRHFHQHGLRTGDYLIIEDTIPWIPGNFGESDSQQEWGDWKWQAMREFFQEFEAEYQVDRYYTDFFGYNATWNWNGFLRRM